MALERNERISAEIERDRSRLRDFIRRRVPDPGDAEDVLQDVFAELVEANRLLMPIEHVTGWLYRVARNRIVDLFRKKRPERAAGAEIVDADGERLDLLDRLPAPGGGPEAEFARGALIEELERAIAELPKDQRDVFVAHEIEERSFREIAAATGVNLNTLLARKRYAVLRLRERLKETYDDLNEG